MPAHRIPSSPTEVAQAAATVACLQGSAGQLQTGRQGDTSSSDIDQDVLALARLLGRQLARQLAAAGGDLA